MKSILLVLCSAVAIAILTTSCTTTTHSNAYSGGPVSYGGSHYGG